MRQPESGLKQSIYGEILTEGGNSFRPEFFADDELSIPRCTGTMQNNFWLTPLEACRVAPVSSSSTILVVDDDPDIRSLTRTFLEHEGYQVYSSGDAARALQIYTSVPKIDLLITDLYMPNGSGME